MPRPPQYATERTQTQIRLPVDLHAQAKAEAETRQISLNLLIENALSAYLGATPRIQTASSEISHPAPKTKRAPRIQRR